MKIQKNTKVKCFLNNGSSVEGIVIEWSEDNIQINCYDNTITIIHHPEDVFITKILLSDKLPPNKKFVPIVLEKELVDTYNEPSQPETPEGNLRLKKLVDLKVMMKDQEKKIIADKLKSHTISHNTAVPGYGYPFAISPQTKASQGR